MDTVTFGAIIIGLINIIKEQFPQVKGIYGVAIAVALGIIGGFFGILGVNITNGILIALASSGVYTVAKRAGGQ